MNRDQQNNAEVSVLSVHNVVSHENVPIESVLHLNPQRYALRVFAIYQRQQELVDFLEQSQPSRPLECYAFEWRKTPLRSTLRIGRILATQSPAIIHLHHAVSAALVACLALWYSPQSRIVTTVHGSFRRLRYWQQGLLLIALLRSQKILCNSHATADTLPNWLRSRRAARIDVCYNGVAIDQLAPPQMLPPTSSEPRRSFVIGTVARLVREKDLDTLLRGFAQLRRDAPDARLVIVGDGPQRQTLQQTARELGVASAVDFKGRLPRDQVYQVLTTLDAYVVSSATEGFCNAMVEAMLAGVPVVATRIAALAEVLSESCGLFFDVGDATQLAEQVLRLRRSPVLAQALGRAARRRAEQRFTMQHCVQRQTQCYEQITRRAA